MRYPSTLLSVSITLTFFILAFSLPALVSASPAVPSNSENRQPQQAVLMKNDPSFPQFDFGSGRVYQSSRIGVDETPHGMSLEDCLTIQRSASLFFEYARDISSVSSRLLAGSTRSSLLVPNDRAIMSMTRKPHQSPDGNNTDESARKGVEKFLSAHIIPGDVDLSHSNQYSTLLPGHSVRIVETSPQSGQYLVQPGNIVVQSIKEASNGRIFYLDGVVPY